MAMASPILLQEFSFFRLEAVHSFHCLIPETASGSMLSPNNVAMGLHSSRGTSEGVTLGLSMLAVPDEVLNQGIEPLISA